MTNNTSMFCKLMHTCSNMRQTILIYSTAYFLFKKIQHVFAKMNNNARTKSNPILYNTDKKKVVQRHQNLASTYSPNYKRCCVTFAVAAI